MVERDVCAQAARRRVDGENTLQRLPILEGGGKSIEARRNPRVVELKKMLQVSSGQRTTRHSGARQGVSGSAHPASQPPSFAGQRRGTLQITSIPRVTSHEANVLWILRSETSTKLLVEVARDDLPSAYHVPSAEW